MNNPSRHSHAEPALPKAQGGNPPLPRHSREGGNPEQLITQHLDTWTNALKPKATAGRGSNGKTELYGIKKLRELILELAVRGLLVPQDPNDEPASVLLEKIAAEKARLVKEGKIKKTKALPSIGEDEKPFRLPESWSWAKLAEIGLVASSSRVLQKDWQSDGVPFYRAREIVKLSQNGGVKNELFISEQLFHSLSEKGVVPVANDIMFTGVGTIGVPYVVKDADRFYFKDASVLIFKNFFNIPPLFLYLFMISPYWVRTIHEGSMGTTVHTLTIARANSVDVPVPPLEEQHRIVAKVDELMALCDQLEQQTEASLAAHQTLVETLLSALTQAPDAQVFSAAWQRIAEHFDTLFTTEQSINQLTQCILQLAVMGKLVPQDPNDEPANELLERIACERERLIQEERLKTKAKLEITDSDKYLKVPESWRYIRLGNIAKFIDYRGKTPTKLSEGIRLITAKNVRFGHISLEPEEFISEEEYTVWMTRGFPRVGDLLFTPEAPLGNVAIIDLTEKFALAQRAICFQLHEPACATFLKIFIMSYPFQEQLHLNATGMTATGIKASKLKEIAIPMPSLPEQHRIVSKVDELMTLCDQLKARLTQAQTTQLHLADAITEQAV